MCSPWGRGWALPATGLSHDRYRPKQIAPHPRCEEREDAVNASDERTKSLWMRVDVLPKAAQSRRQPEGETR